jgi:hypothetical protein
MPPPLSTTSTLICMAPVGKLSPGLGEIIFTVGGGDCAILPAALAPRHPASPPRITRAKSSGV